MGSSARAHLCGLGRSRAGGVENGQSVRFPPAEMSGFEVARMLAFVSFFSCVKTQVITGFARSKSQVFSSPKS